MPTIRENQIKKEHLIDLSDRLHASVISMETVLLEIGNIPGASKRKPKKILTDLRHRIAARREVLNEADEVLEEYLRVLTREEHARLPYKIDYSDIDLRPIEKMVANWEALAAEIKEIYVRNFLK